MAWVAAMAAGCATAPPPPKPAAPVLGARFEQAAAWPGPAEPVAVAGDGAGAAADRGVDPAAGPSAEVARFWRRFQDPTLDRLVEEALAANPSVRQAAASLRESRALSGVADAQAGPQVGASAGATRNRARDTNGVVQTGNLFSAGFDVAWEVDLFGRIAGDREAAAATVRASAAGLAAAQVSLAAEVARQYFALRGVQQQRAVAQSALETQQAALKLVEARLQVGRGTALDAERARGLVATTAASLPALDAAALAARYRLAVLAGRSPADVEPALAAALDAPRPLPRLAPTDLGRIGTPEALLRRRPDVQAAEAQLAAAAARVGVSTAELFPRVTLGGSIGLAAARPSDLLEAASGVYALGARLAWSLIDSGRQRALIEAASARGDAALAAYEGTVLQALQETESALAAYSRTEQRLEHLAAAAVAAQKASTIARARFTEGASDFLAVLDAERDRLAALDRLIDAQVGTATSLVGVYKALSGGWPAES